MSSYFGSNVSLTRICQCPTQQAVASLSTVCLPRLGLLCISDSSTGTKSTGKVLSHKPSHTRVPIFEPSRVSSISSSDNTAQSNVLSQPPSFRLAPAVCLFGLQFYASLDPDNSTQRKDLPGPFLSSNTVVCPFDFGSYKFLMMSHSPTAQTGPGSRTPTNGRDQRIMRNLVCPWQQPAQPCRYLHTELNGKTIVPLCS
jgi:hypothetical protein